MPEATGAKLADAVGVAEMPALAFRPDTLREALWQCAWVEAADRRIARVAFIQLLDAAALRAGFQALAESYAVDWFGDKAENAMGMIASVASRLRLVLTKPVEPEGDEVAA